MCRKTFGHLRGGRARGMLLAEAVISLAICAALLTAAAAGFVAASNAIRTNDEFTRATQAARVILVQLEEQIRTDWVDPAVVVDGNGNATQLRVKMNPSAPSYDRTYKYDSTKKQLLLVTNSSTTDPDYVLARNVSSCKFSIDKGTDSSGAAAVTQVGITITVTVGSNQVLLSGSAAPRQSLVN